MRPSGRAGHAPALKKYRRSPAGKEQASELDARFAAFLGGRRHEECESLDAQPEESLAPGPAATRHAPVRSSCGRGRDETHADPEPGRDAAGRSARGDHAGRGPRAVGRRAWSGADSTAGRRDRKQAVCPAFGRRKNGCYHRRADDHHRGEPDAACPVRPAHHLDSYGDRRRGALPVPVRPLQLCHGRLDNRQAVQQQQHLYLDSDAGRGGQVHAPGLGAELRIDCRLRCVQDHGGLRHPQQPADDHVGNRQHDVPQALWKRHHLDRERDRRHRAAPVPLHPLQLHDRDLDDRQGLHDREHVHLDSDACGDWQVLLPGVGLKRGVDGLLRCLHEHGPIRHLRSSPDDHEPHIEPGLAVARGCLDDLDGRGDGWDRAAPIPLRAVQRANRDLERPAELRGEQHIHLDSQPLASGPVPDSGLGQERRLEHHVRRLQGSALHHRASAAARGLRPPGPAGPAQTDRNHAHLAGEHHGRNRSPPVRLLPLLRDDGNLDAGAELEHQQALHLDAHARGGGDYSLQVWVRNAGTTSGFDAYANIGPVCDHTADDRHRPLPRAGHFRADQRRDRAGPADGHVGVDRRSVRDGPDGVSAFHAGHRQPVRRLHGQLSAGQLLDLPAAAPVLLERPLRSRTSCASGWRGLSTRWS